VHGSSHRGNYWLTNEYGEILKNSYPITKLKIVEEGEPEYVMEAIRDMRERKGCREYLVKWEGFSEKENSWVSEKDFTDVDLINNFVVNRKENETANTEVPETEIGNEKRRSATKIKYAQGNVFNEKNTVSLAVCIPEKLEESSEAAAAFLNKFNHRDRLNELNLVDGDVRALKDDKRFIIYVVTNEPNPSTDKRDKVAKQLRDKCVELKVTRVAIAKTGFAWDSTDEDTTIYRQYFEDEGQIKLTVHDYAECGVKATTTRSSRTSARINLLFTLLCFLLKLALCTANHPVQGPFKLCATTFNSPIISTQGDCQIQNRQDLEERNLPFKVLEKLTYEINGEAFAYKKNSKHLHDDLPLVLVEGRTDRSRIRDCTGAKRVHGHGDRQTMRRPPNGMRRSFMCEQLQANGQV
jgi:hypothetical protein